MCSGILSPRHFFIFRSQLFYEYGIFAENRAAARLCNGVRASPVFPKFDDLSLHRAEGLIFSSLVILLAGLAVTICIAERRFYFRPRAWSPLGVVVGLFFLSVVLSTIFGVDLHRSFWDTHERMLGAWTLFHYGAFFYLARFFLGADWVRWRLFFGATALAGLAVVGIGIIQKISPDFLVNRGSDRVYSTLGNPIYLSAYGLFLFFFSLVAAVRESGWARYVFYVSALAGFIGLILGNTRGTWLGFFFVLALTLLLLALRRGTRRRDRIASSAALALGIVLVALVIIFRHSPVLQRIPVVDRFATLATTRFTADTRFGAWGIAIDAWRERPVFGWGPENYFYAFNTFYDPVFLQYGFQETWFDNAHNVFLNTLATQGALGIISYLGIFGVAFVGISRRYARESDATTRRALFLAAAWLVAHGIHTVFVFESPTSYLTFFSFLAFIDAETWHRRAPEPAAAPVSVLTLAIPAALALAAVLLTQGRVFQANRLEYQARGIMSQGKYKESLVLFDQIRRFRTPYQAEINWDFATDVLNHLPRVYVSDKEMARELYDRAVFGLEETVALHPDDVRARLTYMDMLRSGGIVLFELPVNSIVKENLRIARELSPRRQQVEYAEITYLAGTGHLDEAMNQTKALIARDPLVAEGYYTMGRLYAFKKDFKPIIDVLDQAILNGIRFSDPVHIGFAAEMYELEGRFRDALYWYDQAYRATGLERTAFKRDELAGMTELPVPTSLDEFFPYAELRTDPPQF